MTKASVTQVRYGVRCPNGYIWESEPKDLAEAKRWAKWAHETCECRETQHAAGTVTWKDA